MRFVEYQTIKTTAPAFRVGTTPLAKVGGLRNDPDEEIGPGTAEAVRLSDGRVAVLEDRTVRILHSSGRLARVIGGRGSGPGLFDAQLTKVCRIRGDTLVLVSNGSRRVGVFDPTGNHVRTLTIDGSVRGNCGDDGAMLVGRPSTRETRQALSAQDAVTAPTREVLFRLTRDGKLSDSVGVFDGVIGSNRSAAIESDRFTVEHFGETFYADNGSKPEIKAYSSTGALTSVLRWRDPLIPVTDKLIEQISEARNPSGPASARATTLARFTQVKQRPFLPAYRAFVVDRVGRIWLRDYWPPILDYKPAGEIPGYTVFSSDGTLLGRFEVPRSPGSGIVTDAGADYVVIRGGSADEGVVVLVLSIATAR